MKSRAILIFISIISLFMMDYQAFADTVPPIDKAKIKFSLKNFVKAVNMGDEQAVSELISPDKQALQKEIIEKVAGGVRYELDYNPFDENVEMIDSENIRLTTVFAAAGPGWTVNGASSYFILQKNEGKWYISDTDFHKKLGAGYVFDTIMTIFLYMLPVVIILMSFWLWMLIDCIKRDFDDKVLWIALLLIMSFPAAILYFFIVKRKKQSFKPLEPLILD